MSGSMRVFVDGKQLPPAASVRVEWKDHPVTLPDGKERTANVSASMSAGGMFRVVVLRDTGKKIELHAEEEFSVSDFCWLTTL